MLNLIVYPLYKIVNLTKKQPLSKQKEVVCSYFNNKIKFIYFPLV